MPKVYNKLVRDRVPEIIHASGAEAFTQVMSEEAYLISLVEKLKEEVAEYASDPNPEELVDIIEVVLALAKDRFNLSIEQLEDIRQQKYLERGGFEKHLLLVEVAD